jgi:hypothetical protein
VSIHRVGVYLLAGSVHPDDVRDARGIAVTSPVTPTAGSHATLGRRRAARRPQDRAPGGDGDESLVGS